MTSGDSAKKTFIEGFNCAQAVLTAYSGRYGMHDFAAKKISCAFGAGCARQSLTCGAVTGALMVVGLKYGKTEANDDESKELTYKKVNEFVNKFKTKYSSVNCYELLGCDLATEEGRAFYSENDLFHNECIKYINDTCEILDQMGL